MIAKDLVLFLKSSTFVEAPYDILNQSLTRNSQSAIVVVLRLRRPETRLLEQSTLFRHANSIRRARVGGRLYHIHAGFPAIEVPQGLILAHGSVDPLADARRQQEIGTPHFGRPTGDWDLIHAQLVNRKHCVVWIYIGSPIRPNLSGEPIERV
jgi:hypothetical protein